MNTETVRKRVEVTQENVEDLKVRDSLVDNHGLFCPIVKILDVREMKEVDERIDRGFLISDPMRKGDRTIWWHRFYGFIDDDEKPLVRFSDPEAKLLLSTS